jgi:hypothetical protein
LILYAERHHLPPTSVFDAAACLDLCELALEESEMFGSSFPSPINKDQSAAPYSSAEPHRQLVPIDPDTGDEVVPLTEQEARSKMRFAAFYYAALGILFAVALSQG